MHAEALRPALRAAVVHLPSTRLLEIATRALTASEVTGSQRRIWSFIAFALDPANQSGRFLSEHRADAAQLFDEDIREALLEPFRKLEEPSLVWRETAVIRLLARSTPPEQGDAGWYFTGPAQTIRSAINLLSRSAFTTAGPALASLASDSDLRLWRPALRHAHATWASLQREQSYHYPGISEIIAALAGGPPINAADLLAIVVEELQGFAAELHSGDNTPWKTYWNIDSHGGVEKPVVENECRNRLLERLRDRLKPYGIAASLPEIRRSEDRRVDMLILSHAGWSLPVELKRHYHPDVWTAPVEQLADYAHTHGADNYGVYLVFWFGLEVGAPPKRSDRRVPAGPAEMHTLLVEDLPPELRDTFRVVVFDASQSK